MQDGEVNDVKVGAGTVTARKAAIVVHFATSPARAKPMNDYPQKTMFYCSDRLFFFPSFFLFLSLSTTKGSTDMKH